MSNDAPQQPSAIYVWLVPSEQVLEQPGSWRIRKWDTKPFQEANYTLNGTTPNGTNWIPVSDRLPDAGVVVLVSGWAHEKPGTTRWAMLAMRGEVGYNGSDWWALDGEDKPEENIYRPTHWIPMPAAPSDEQR